jgi:hypothetical protein
MTLSDRDRRALLLLGFAGIGVLLYTLISDAAPAGQSGSPQEAIALAEKRLERMRQLAAEVPAREETYKQMAAQLAIREKRLLKADTAAQAQAQLLAVLRRVARAQNPPVELRASEFGTVRPFGEAYGEVPVSVMMECGIEQLLNILSDLTVQQEMAAVTDLRIYSANQKQKTTNVRLTVAGVVPKSLIRERKGVTE